MTSCGTWGTEPEWAELTKDTLQEKFRGQLGWGQLWGWQKEREDESTDTPPKGFGGGSGCYCVGGGGLPSITASCVVVTEFYKWTDGMGRWLSGQRTCYTGHTA